jgi:prepilin-type N-terminal cleavage/methylation domain-containing protein
MMSQYVRKNYAQARRAGFTLVELLVVIALIALIASLSLLMFPGYNEREQVASGASRLQGAFNAAKTRALLDRAPRGIRLLPDESTNSFYSQIQYLEQPEDYSEGTVSTDSTDTNNQTLNFQGADLTGGDVNFPLVQTGDYILIGDGSLVRRITAASSTQATIASGLPNAITNMSYRVIRQPRVMADEPLRMPANVGIDITYSQNCGFTAGQPLDIMFTPAGSVYGNASSTSMRFLVRDFGRDPANPVTGEPTAIVLYPRTGFVASYDVNPDPAALYDFVR